MLGVNSKAVHWQRGVDEKKTRRGSAERREDGAAGTGVRGRQSQNWDRGAPKPGLVG